MWVILIHTPYVMKIFILWDLPISAKWLSQEVKLYSLCVKAQLNRSLPFDRRLRIFFKQLYLFSRPSFIFQSGPLGLHLFFNHRKSLLFLSDVGQMRGCSFKVESGITVPLLSQEKENEDISILTWKKKKNCFIQVKCQTRSCMP